jgi:signal transduction histidine kinase
MRQRVSPLDVSAMASHASLFTVWYHRFLRAHPAERGGDLWFQEEARAERLSNLIRIVYILAWLGSTTLHAPGNYFWSNFGNLGVGGLWLLWAVGFQTWLYYRPYHPGYKFVSTAVDMVLITAILWVYQFAAGPVYALKVPTYLNYFCCLGLASLRFRKGLAVFGGVLAVGLYLALFIDFNLRYHLVYGTGAEHTLTSKISGHYIAYQLVYLGVFSFLTYVMAVNVKRLVELRARESLTALRAQERALVAASVAHEIKNPLEGIYGAAQLLIEEGKGSPRFVQMILKDSIRLNETVHQFLRFSRPFIPKMSQFDLVAELRSFCRAQSELSAGSSPEFTTGMEHFSITSDPEGIHQILLNLVQNARRYQPEGLPVRLHLESHGEVAEVRVEDDGKGVPEEHRGRLFEAFHTTSPKGTGLGLAISRKIARELGGDLYYEPLQPGTRFVLVLKNHAGRERIS